MKKILFVIHDLHHGGAEKVLVNLVNNMDRKNFDITVMALFGGGVNEQFLKKDVKLIICHKRAVRGNSKIMKFFSPHFLFNYYIKDKYDIIVSYLEGPSARIVSGCSDKNTKLVSWIHVEQHDKNVACNAFRDYKEALVCYRRFDCTVCVSEYVKKDFLSIFSVENPVYVLYNTNETDQIRELAKDSVDDIVFKGDEIKLVGVGKLMPNKGFDKLARIHARLIREGYKVHTYILGEGPERNKIEKIVDENGCADTFTLLGYRTNPYKYVAKCDIFVCSSVAEGFSTATTEALILGVPVVTTRVSGMEEMLGKNNEFGIVVNGTDETSLFLAIQNLLNNPQLLQTYRYKSLLRGKDFFKERTIKKVEQLFESLELFMINIDV